MSQAETLENIKNLLDEEFNFEVELFNECVWISDACCITYETSGDLAISFNIETFPDMAAIITKVIMENNYKIEVYESFWFDDDYNIHFVNDKPKYEFSLN